MDFNIERAFSFFKNDTDWLKKLMFGNLLALIAMLFFFLPLIVSLITKTFNLGYFIFAIFCFIAGFIIALSIAGYCAQAGHDRIGSNAPILPQWDDFGKYIFLGFKYFIGSVAFYLPVILLGCAVSFGIAFLKISAHASDINALSFIFNSFYNIIYLVFMAFYFLFCANFIKDFDFTSFLNYPKAFKLVKNNWINYLVLILIALAVGIVFNIVAVIMALTIVGIFLIPFVSIYFQIVTYDIIAQYIDMSDVDTIQIEEENQVK